MTPQWPFSDPLVTLQWFPVIPQWPLSDPQWPLSDPPWSLSGPSGLRADWRWLLLKLLKHQSPSCSWRNYRIYLIENLCYLFQTWHCEAGIYLTPKTCLSSLFMEQWFFFIDFYRHNLRSVISAAYYTSNKYFRGLFKTPPWRPGVYLKPAV